MKRVLVLSYYYPPLGGAGVQRTAKFVKHLPDFGYEAVVIAGPAETSLAWAPKDATLASDVEGTRVIRLPGPEPSWSRGWLGRSERWLGRRSRFSRWWVSGTTALGREHAREADVIYATMSPFETADAAMHLAHETGTPWVADLRDPWALDDWAVYPTALHRRLDERRMRRRLSRADAVVLNCPEATRSVLGRFPELRSRRVATIPNGWAAEDFEPPVAARDDAAFRIVYVGYAHVDAGIEHRAARLRRRVLGGSTPGLDVLARSHLYLLDAVDALVGEDPSLRDRLEVHLAGAHHPGDARTSGHPLVRFHGYLAHPDALALMRSADLLFLPMQDLPPGTRARTVPGKTYEYLAATRPILGALPDGDARDLLGSLHAHLCRPRETACIAETIRSCLRQPAGREPMAVPGESLAGWERRELTRRLATVFDATIAGDPLPRAQEG